MQFSEAEKEIAGKAINFARKNKKKIAKRVTNKEIFASEDEPVSVFMAGSPGAGKTEASKALLDTVNGEGYQILRIDPDELRDEFEDYDGGNSWLFQGAISILVAKIIDLALRQKQSFLLDGTLASYRVAEENIRRCLNKGRLVQILYVYQKPHLAWEFVQAREEAEGRRIRPESFIDQYFSAREVVNQLKQKFKKEIQVDLLLKDNDGSNKVYKDNIDKIDNYVPEKYTRADLESLITLS